jgi:6-phosphogluconolactonase
MANETLLIVSTLTETEGILVHRIADADGRLQLVQQTKEIREPFYIALHPQADVLYSITDPGGKALVSALALDRDSGVLTLINQQPTHGEYPCYVDVDPSGRAALVANYNSGSVASYPLGEDGALGTGSSVQHVGDSVGERQKGPHAHCFKVAADGRFAFAADLGMDQVVIYALDAARGTITPGEQALARVYPGSGPRHFTFAPDNRHAYAINELGNTVTAFAYDADRGLLLERGSVPTLPDDFDGVSHTADLALTPDGRFLFGTNRGHDSIAMFTVDTESGALTPNGVEDSRGGMPQNLTITADGSLLFCADTKGDKVVAFHIDAGSGKLSLASENEMPAPVCAVLG